MYLILDNFDSFVYTIQAYLEELGRPVVTRRCDTLTVPAILAMNPTGIILSPGPKRPEDALLCQDVVRTLGASVPILGVCLGFQVLAYMAGAVIRPGTVPKHGKISTLTHTGRGLFAGLPQHFRVTRYHSLALQQETLPPTYRVDAVADDGVVMAISHQTLPLYGVQFHPEAILTEYGHEIFANFCHLAEERRPSDENQ